MQFLLAEDTSSSPWKMSHLTKALSDLKKNKSRDHAGYKNEIFKEEVCGTDLKKSLFVILNSLKLKKMIQNS